MLKKSERNLKHFDVFVINFTKITTDNQNSRQISWKQFICSNKKATLKRSVLLAQNRQNFTSLKINTHAQCLFCCALKL